MEGLVEGRIVHYVLPDGRSEGEHRPAIVVKVWRVDGKPQENGCCQLQVFSDGVNDGARYTDGIVWATSVVHSAELKLGTWHWPEKA